MRLLQVAISCYLIGLLIFYTFATFETMAWDISYFAWAKLCDAGTFFWWALYYTMKPQVRDTIKWLCWFSVARFLLDIQSFFTGVGVNNEWVVAASFLLLIVVIIILTIKEFQHVRKK